MFLMSDDVTFCTLKKKYDHIKVNENGKNTNFLMKNKKNPKQQQQQQQRKTKKKESICKYIVAFFTVNSPH